MDPNNGSTFRPELIIALVGPAGVKLEALCRALKQYLREGFHYETREIRLSNLLEAFEDWTPEPDRTEYTRITHRQELGRKFRLALNDGAALARAGIAAIRKERAAITGSPDRPASNYAYVVQQLKHPSEVALLRKVYGSSFYLVAGHAPHAIRVNGLVQQMTIRDDQTSDPTYREKAEHIIHIDDKQDDDLDLGQNTRDTYPLADFFANLSNEGAEQSVNRFIDLMFGHPFHTPLPEEYAMYQASAGSLRSSDENRQVGAAIVNFTRNASGKITNADIIASGMNEVPRRGGGFYWHDDSPDGRDQWLIANWGEDRATKIKRTALAELIEKIKGSLIESERARQPLEIARALLPGLKGTQFMNIGEFSRPVHAEMAAIIDAARRGVPVNKQTMCVTTFPCHNCAKHIIAAGLERVIYLEPYPKSKAELLHGEEINLESTDGVGHDERVVFSAFSGVAPRQYQQLFSMSARGRKAGLSLTEWNLQRATLCPRYVIDHAAAAYVLAERQELDQLPEAIYHWDSNIICPPPPTP